jgi:hypothetical protein
MKKHLTTLYKGIETILFIAAIGFGVWILSLGVRMLYAVWSGLIG